MACEEYRSISVFCVHRLPASALRFFLGPRRHKPGNADRDYTRLQPIRLSTCTLNRSKSLVRGTGPWACQRTRGLAAVARSLRVVGNAASNTRSTTGIAISQLSANGNSEPGAWIRTVAGPEA